MPELELPDWFDPNEDETEQVLAAAEFLFTNYPKHALAFGIAKMIQQKLVHPELAKINVDMGKDFPLSLFVETMNDRNISLHDLIESLKS